MPSVQRGTMNKSHAADPSQSCFLPLLPPGDQGLYQEKGFHFTMSFPPESHSDTRVKSAPTRGLILLRQFRKGPCLVPIQKKKSAGHPGNVQAQKSQGVVPEQVEKWTLPAQAASSSSSSSSSLSSSLS